MNKPGLCPWFFIESSGLRLGGCKTMIFWHNLGIGRNHSIPVFQIGLLLEWDEQDDCLGWFSQDNVKDENSHGDQ
jgi:hypothetical protein